MTKQGQNTNVKKLNQRIENQYKSMRATNNVFSVILLVVLMIFVGLFSLFFSASASYNEKMTAFDQELNTLQEEKAAIESGKIVTAEKSFDTILQENLANLKEYPQSENNYTISIEGTNSQITLNKNNIFVSDNANMLNKETKQKIYELNKQLAASTNGAQLEVITIPELPRGEDIESYANKLFNQLGIGDKNENNGILYLIALDDREFRLEVGYGLEGLIPDGTADSIINDDDVVDAFKDEKYDQAVNQVLDQVFPLMNTKTALVDSKINQVESQKSATIWGRWGLGFFLFFALLTNLILVIRSLSAGKALKQTYGDYQNRISGFTNEDAATQLAEMKQTNFYHLMLSGSSLIASKRKLRRSIAQGRLLKHPSAQRKAFGRVLIGDTLYSGDGYVLTTTYLTSNYNSANWSDSSNGSDGGGSSWGSFGGGSSGGGGASGGW
ncbi:TPM domain-containing protein [Enterococcus sp. AZ192]|uniref:TPM domain-containing protein n=1 Tax=unclassified Enterococcus TaxID=2608891 RepID=UPI003D2AF658